METQTTSPPLVSVILPCFNAGLMLRPALSSVIGQTWPNLEVIFVDNNSTDGSVNVAKQVAAGQSRPFTFAHCSEQGVNVARNHGFALARGAYIQWMDADDALDLDKIALQVAALQGDPAANIAYGDWTARRLEPGRPASTVRHRLRQVDDQVRRTLAGVWYPPHLYLLRRGAAQRLQDVQAWRTQRAVATDVEYSALAALLGLRFLYVAGAHVDYNIWSPEQISGDTPYLERVAALKAMFADLAAFAQSDMAGAALTRAHKVLLHQNWDIWRLPRGSAVLTKAAGRRFRFRHTASGREIDLRPREAAMAKALMAPLKPLASCHLALMLADTVPQIHGDHAAAIEFLGRLQREDFLERVASQGDRGSDSAP